MDKFEMMKSIISNSDFTWMLNFGEETPARFGFIEFDYFGPEDCVRMMILFDGGEIKSFEEVR